MFYRYQVVWYDKFEDKEVTSEGIVFDHDVIVGDYFWFRDYRLVENQERAGHFVRPFVFISVKSFFPEGVYEQLVGEGQ